MEKRYQVFVSSTYQDLQEERQEIMQALLELDCIPSGMELFPAANDDQWTLIKKVIDDSDYYIVIIAGRYGSIGPEGYSYTEMEYRYALETKKPIIAFLHKNPLELPVNRYEKENEGREKLEKFRELAEKKLVKYWSTPAELGSIVSRSLVQLIKNNPAIGWIRANKGLNEEASIEMLKLRKQIDELNIELEKAKTTAPEGTEKLAQGDDEYTIEYIFASYKTYYDNRKYHGYSTEETWNDIFYHLGPCLMDENDEQTMKEVLNEFLLESQFNVITNLDGLKGTKIVDLEIKDSSFQTIKIQLKALGLIEKSKRSRSVKDTRTYWALTDFGDGVLTRLRAIVSEKV